MTRLKRKALAMNRSFLVVTSAVAVGLSFAHDSWAAGTAVNVQSARATGMASAVTAMIDDSSAIYYNPAGIAQGKGINVLVGDTLIKPSFSFRSATTGNSASTSGVVTPFHLYATGGLTENLSAGVGVFSPFGTTVKWPSNWEGRSLATQSSQATFYINPTVAYRIGPLRIGGGLQIVRSTLDLQRKIVFPDQEGSSEVGADSWGVGANFGAQVEAVRQYLSFGVHYRSAVKLNFTGNVHFDNIPASFVGTIHDQRMSTSLVEPDSLAFGIASRPIPPLVLDLDLVWFGWSKLHSIDTNFPDDASGTLASSQLKNWKNVFNVHFGGEAKVADAWRIRAGTLYDPTPSPADTLTPELLDTNRLNLALGGSYVHKSGFHIDLGYQLILLFKKTSTAPQLPGEYHGGRVDILGVSVGYATPR